MPNLLCHHDRHGTVIKRHLIDNFFVDTLVKLLTISEQKNRCKTSVDTKYDLKEVMSGNLKGVIHIVIRDILNKFLYCVTESPTFCSGISFPSF